MAFAPSYYHSNFDSPSACAETAMHRVVTQISQISRVEVQHPQSGYRGRVRSGCLTCRSRKIKCDEGRPICNKCIKFGKADCVYKPRKALQHRDSGTGSSHRNVTREESVQGSTARRLPDADSFSSTYPSTRFADENRLLEKTSRDDDATEQSWEAEHEAIGSPDRSIVGITARIQAFLQHSHESSITVEDTELDAISPSTLISRDIKLTTTMDFLTAGEAPQQLSFSFFAKDVDCPSITPYDGIKWQQIKHNLVNLGMSNSAVASAIIAVSTLYKGQLYSLPLSKAVSLYSSAKADYEKLVNNETQNFDMILAAMFLLCLFQFIHYEAAPMFKHPSDNFHRRLTHWAQNPSTHSELSSRIIVWLRLLHATTLRGGGMGLFSDSIDNLLPCYNEGIPNSKLPSVHHLDSSAQLNQMLSAPIFEFYFQLQMISGDIAKLTHYHRSRTTGADQEEVVQQTTLVKSRLHALWESRSATQSQTPADLRSHLASQIANPIISLIGVCTAAFHAEFVEINRVLGDPVSVSTESQQAMCRIREIVEGDWNAYDGDKLNPGYLRPLFLYAIECMDRDENQWAVEKLGEIQNLICRSDFFAAFGKALSDAQLRKERRVTSKYFCIWYFGVPPPFL